MSRSTVLTTVGQLDEVYEFVNALDLGQPFKANGRVYSLSSYSLDGYADRVVVNVWASNGNRTKLSLRPTTTMEALR